MTAGCGAVGPRGARRLVKAGGRTPQHTCYIWLT
ncbi:MAG TPA: hypothetical protein DEF41_02055 [Desulfovibrio sp.]|nr:hypothetical protein [Desulfovibrio sp.]